LVSQVQVYTPYRSGLPNLRVYVQDLWSRRQFATEMARTQLRSQHFNTAFGQLWLVLNPLLLTFVYYLLVSIIASGAGGPDYLAHIMAGLFAFYYFSACLSGGASSVVGGGKLILNTAFPKVLLPLSAVLVAMYRFLPTLVIYGVVHVVTDRPVGAQMLWALPMFLLLTLFAFGCSLLFAAANVYFRDTKNFLPYLLRVWLYASPVLYSVDRTPEVIRVLNPLVSILGIWSEALVHGKPPSPGLLALAVVWALVAVVAGGYVFLIREGEFAVRI
jgi:teichoic acid transport system permease protein